MLKQKNIITFCILISSFGLLSWFQNCAPMVQSGETTMSSIADAETIAQPHPTGEDPGDLKPAADPSLAISKSLMDREMIYAMFVDILGPDVINTNQMRKIKAEKKIFGSPCSVYENNRYTSAGFNADNITYKTDPMATPCANSEDENNMGASLEPSANILHQALVNEVCVASMAPANLYNYMISQVKENPAVVIPANTDQNVLKMFSLFYREKPMPDTTVINSFKAIVGEPATVNGWKNLFITICTSSHWQAL
jgi:hypothetical protein